MAAVCQPDYKLHAGQQPNQERDVNRKLKKRDTQKRDTQKRDTQKRDTQKRDTQKKRYSKKEIRIVAESATIL
ncbi:hypothetical protein [Methanosarcina acetivorans]|uniref:Uncharacterized protein n=1 Tax=Methanosarcina acetivorans (strain ATCC 35395 / DSM 2834 / JCM 12185 / C2A) TaxID=188937 RepID=Q8TT32_METAC|nr:hypothetical protein [Methanosarcina acetivorans]AAM04051.1 predicted protein [Methanosarcina acetivorans C2A]